MRENKGGQCRLNVQSSPNCTHTHTHSCYYSSSLSVWRDEACRSHTSEIATPALLKRRTVNCFEGLFERLDTYEHRHTHPQQLNAITLYEKGAYENTSPARRLVSGPTGVFLRNASLLVRCACCAMNIEFSEHFQIANPERGCMHTAHTPKDLLLYSGARVRFFCEKTN